MQETKQFRCPFEVKGIEDSTIIEVELTSDKSARLKAMIVALVRLRESLDSPAVRFVLPPTVLHGCVSIRQLRSAILPYQAEVVAADIDVLMRPLLSYQMKPWSERIGALVAKTEPERVLAAVTFLRFLQQNGIPIPESVEQQSSWIEIILARAMEQGVKNPQINMSRSVSNERQAVITLDPSAFILHCERQVLDDPLVNRNCFGIVKCPLYPKDFARHSERVEIVVSREADFAALSRDVRERIRTQSNAVYRAHGVNITDLASDKQPTGLWEPEYI